MSTSQLPAAAEPTEAVTRRRRRARSAAAEARVCEDRTVTHVHVEEQPLVQPAEASQLSLGGLTLGAGEAAPLAGEGTDALLFVTDGAGDLELGGAKHALRLGSGALVLADESATVTAGA